MKKDKHKNTPSGENHKIPEQIAEGGLGRFSWFDAAGLMLIMLAGAAIYSNSFDCSFHFDDRGSVFENEDVRIFKSLYEWLASGYNRPLSMYTFSLNYQLGKYDVRGYHYLNLAIHLVNSLMVWWLTSLIFTTPVMRKFSVSRFRGEIAFLTALIFVAHPMATQSVTYIVQRMASLAALFYLLSAALYIKGRMSVSWTRYLYLPMALVAGIMSVWSKENAYTLPLSIALVEICFLQDRKLSPDFRDYRVLLGLAALVAVFITIPLKFSFSIFKPILPAHGQTYVVTPLNYLLTQFSVIVKYLQLLIFPMNQNLDYDYPISNSLFEIRTFLSFLALAGLGVLGIRQFNRNRLVSFGIFWFFITLAVESSIIPVADLINEHRTYLPSFGIWILVTTSFFMWFGDRYRIPVMTAFMAVAGIYSVLTYQRNKVWKDDLSLWSDVIEKSPMKARPLGTRGDYYRDRNQLDSAIADYSRAIRANPKYFTALHNRGFIYAKRKEWDKAVADYSKAIEYYPEYMKAYNNRGNAYFDMGQWDNAIKDYTRVIAMDPKRIVVYIYRGASFANLGQWDNALADYSRAIEYDPGYALAYFNRGMAHASLKQWDKAVEDYNAAIRINDKDAQYYFRRGMAYYSLGRMDNAIADYDQAIERDPKFSSAYTNRGVVYFTGRQWDKAYQDFSRAVELDPANAVALSNRNAAFTNLKNKK